MRARKSRARKEGALNRIGNSVMLCFAASRTYLSYWLKSKLFGAISVAAQLKLTRMSCTRAACCMASALSR